MNNYISNFSFVSVAKLLLSQETTKNMTKSLSRTFTLVMGISADYKNNIYTLLIFTQNKSLSFFTKVPQAKNSIMLTLILVQPTLADLFFRGKVTK